MAYYKELNDIISGVIGQIFLRSQNLCKLLYYYPDIDDNTFDPLALPNISNTSELYMKHIFPMPKLPDASLEKKAYLTVVLSGGYEPETNIGYRRVNLLLDVICHLSVWNIKNGYRPYKIMNEIDQLLNNQLLDLPIENKPYLKGFQPRDYSNYFYGFQVMYEMVINSNVSCDIKPQNLNIFADSISVPTPYYMPKNLGIGRQIISKPAGE